AGAAPDLRIVAQARERVEVGGGDVTAEVPAIGQHHQRGEQLIDARQRQVAVAPAHVLQALEAMLLDGAPQPIAERRQRREGAEASILEVAPGSTRDLPELGGRELSLLAPVKFAGARERDVRDVQVE